MTIGLLNSGVLNLGLPLQPVSRGNDPASIKEAAQRLEGAFAQLLIKSMRATSLGDEAFPGASGHYRDLYDQQLAGLLTRGKGLGLVPMIERQLGLSAGNSAVAADEPQPYSLESYDRGVLAVAPKPLPLPLPISPLESEGRPIAPPAALEALQVQTTAPGGVPRSAHSAYARPAARAGTPEDFVARIWPQAQRAAAELGVCPKVLVAQAALETGWGRHLPGAGGNNLFGIKTGGNWQGPRSAASTHEFVGGREVVEAAEFRAYATTAQSFSDYIDLLKHSPRYAHAVGQNSSRGFAAALQNAGYATDPHYAAKLTAIAEGPTLHRALATLDAGATFTLRA